MIFDCPRCRLPVCEELYGPCRGCRLGLRMTARKRWLWMLTCYWLANKEIELVVEWEPEVNVTENAVALTKDDA